MLTKDVAKAAHERQFGRAVGHWGYIGATGGIEGHRGASSREYRGAGFTNSVACNSVIQGWPDNHLPMPQMASPCTNGSHTGVAR